MHVFKYVGGQTNSEHVDPLHGVDERIGAPMPDASTAFGHKFLLGQPVQLKRNAFRTQGLYDHAVAKLKANRYFEEVTVEDAEIVEDIPAPKKRGPKPKPKTELESFE